MSREWSELTQLTNGDPVLVSKVKLKASGISIEGEFELPPLATLTAEEQTFAMAFIKSHGSIKEMERLFGISYPTVKGRLDRLSKKMNLVEHDPAPSKFEVLEKIRSGELSAEDAIRLLKTESKTKGKS